MYIMQSKYFESIGDLIVSGGVILGLLNAGDVVQKEVSAPTPVATIVSNETESGPQLSVTTEKKAYESNIVIMCVSLGIGISYLSPRITNAWKEWRQADSETVQGKLARCECQIEEMEKEYKRKEEDLLENIEDKDKNIESLRRSNEALSKTIEENAKTIMLLSRQSSPVVLDTTQIAKEPDPQSS